MSKTKLHRIPYSLGVAFFFLLSAAHAAEKGTVKIVTEPGEAQITVNGEPKGTSPSKISETFAIKLDEGNYTIEATKDGASDKKQVFVASDTLQTITLKLSKTISDRYLDHGDGTVTDTKTNLMWKQCSEGQSGSSCSGEASKYKWDDAKSKFGSGVSFANHSDWRMPTKDELNSLVYCSNGTPQATAWDKGCGDRYQRPTLTKRHSRILLIAGTGHLLKKMRPAPGVSTSSTVTTIGTTVAMMMRCG